MKNKLLVVLFMIGSMYANAQVTLPYSQNFEASTFPPTGWQTFPIGSGINWERDTTASGYGIGTACTSFDNFNTAAGSYYGIRLPAMDFTGITHPYVRFDIAYAQRTGTGSDIFGFWWSNNGTSNWQNLINYSSGNLTTAPATSSLFVPAAGEWETKTLSLLSLAGLPYVRLAIEDDCNHGNKIYFDNVIVFDSTNVGINEIYNSDQVVVFPNPATNELSIQNNSSQPVQFTLYNSLGEMIMDRVLSDKTTTINLSVFSNGIYFYKLRDELEIIKSGEIIKQ